MSDKKLLKFKLNQGKRSIQSKKQSLQGPGSKCAGCSMMKRHLLRTPWLAAPLLSLALLLGGCTSGPRAAQPSERQATAMAMWQERCKTAGEKIYRTAENVPGVYLMKIRPTTINFSDQFQLSDPYGKDTGGDGYIENFLLGIRPDNAPPLEIVINGYSYIEAQDPTDGQRYRYTGHVEQPWSTNKNYSETYKRFVLDRKMITDTTARYGVTYDDISTQEERKYWIAGSSLKVIDLQTNEVMAERIGYMVDSAQGLQSGGRSPWLIARYNACPRFPGQQTVQTHQTRNFVAKVLKPIKGK